MSELRGFLLARIAEDERRCGGGDEPESWCDRAAGIHLDPARWQAECDAKREIVHMAIGIDHMGPPNVAAFLDGVLRVLAAPYADRPGYRQEWKP